MSKVVAENAKVCRSKFWFFCGWKKCSSFIF